MNKYTFTWSIAPACPAEHALAVPPFDVVIRETTLTLTASADSTDEQRLRGEADQVARNLARTLSYVQSQRFEVADQGFNVMTPGGGQRVSASVRITVGRAAVSAVGHVEAVARDPAGNVIDSSALRREREHLAALQYLTDLTRRAALDPNLRDMLDHWSRYIADPDGRLHPLYDVLQVAERLQGGKYARKKAAVALKMKEKDLDELARISNNPTVLNGRHPGKAQGPHRVATESEVSTCERVAKAIIENCASKIVV